MRSWLLAQSKLPEAGVFARFADFGNYVVGDTFSEANAGRKGRVVADIAAEQGKEPFDMFVEIGLNDELKTVWWPTPTDDDAPSWELRRQIWETDGTLIGGSDAGAHLDRMCGSQYTTRFIADMLRGRKLLSLERAVQLITDAPARLFGLRRGGSPRDGRPTSCCSTPRPSAPGPPPWSTTSPGTAHASPPRRTASSRVFVNGSSPSRTLKANGTTPRQGPALGARHRRHRRLGLNAGRHSPVAASCRMAQVTDLVIFDCDGVLVNSQVLVVHIESEMLAELGADISPAESSGTSPGSPTRPWPTCWSRTGESRFPMRSTPNGPSGWPTHSNSRCNPSPASGRC